MDYDTLVETETMSTWATPQFFPFNRPSPELTRPKIKVLTLDLCQTFHCNASNYTFDHE